MSIPSPIHLVRWIAEHRDELKPPIGNKVLYEDAGFVVMVVGGPNARSDFHISNAEEFFYMLKGDMILRIEEDGLIRDIDIKEGEVFLLPALVPHSPQRAAGTVGLVIEGKRDKDDLDGVRWYCENCHNVLYEEFFALHDIVEQLREIVEKFYRNESLHTCSSCGTIATPPDATPAN